MVKMNMYGPDGQIRESVDLDQREVANDGNCQHPSESVRVVEDNSGIKDVTAYQCEICGFGWLVKNKESKNE